MMNFFLMLSEIASTSKSFQTNKAFEQFQFGMNPFDVFGPEMKPFLKIKIVESFNQ